MPRGRPPKGLQRPSFDPKPTATPIERVGTGQYRLPNHIRPTSVRSIRAYRRMADALLLAAAAGKIRWQDARQGIAAIETAASMYMGEKVMQRSGIEDREDEHVLGEDGGLVLPGRIRSAVTRTVKTTTGIDRHGNQVQTTTVEEQDVAPAADIEASADDDELEALPPPGDLPADDEPAVDPSLAEEIG